MDTDVTGPPSQELCMVYSKVYTAGIAAAHVIQPTISSTASHPRAPIKESES